MHLIFSGVSVSTSYAIAEANYSGSISPASFEPASFWEEKRVPFEILPSGTEGDVQPKSKLYKSYDTINRKRSVLLMLISHFNYLFYSLTLMNLIYLIYQPINRVSEYTHIICMENKRVKLHTLM